MEGVSDFLDISYLCLNACQIVDSSTRLHKTSTYLDGLNALLVVRSQERPNGRPGLKRGNHWGGKSGGDGRGKDGEGMAVDGRGGERKCRGGEGMRGIADGTVAPHSIKPKSSSADLDCIQWTHAFYEGSSTQSRAASCSTTGTIMMSRGQESHPKGCTARHRTVLNRLP